MLLSAHPTTVSTTLARPSLGHDWYRSAFESTHTPMPSRGSPTSPAPRVELRYNILSDVNFV